MSLEDQTEPKHQSSSLPLVGGLQVHVAGANHRCLSGLSHWCHAGIPCFRLRQVVAVSLKAPICTAALLSAHAVTWSETDEAPCSSAFITKSHKEDKDSIQLLDEAEALELVEFNPSMETWGNHYRQSQDSWRSTSTGSTLEDSEEAILKYFPKPSCKAVTAPSWMQYVAMRKGHKRCCLKSRIILT